MTVCLRNAWLGTDEHVHAKILDRSDNPLSEDDHCLAHSLLRSLSSLPQLHIVWPTAGAMLSNEQAVLVYELRGEGQEGCESGDHVFAVGVRELDLEEERHPSHAPLLSAGHAVEAGVFAMEEAVKFSDDVHEINAEGRRVFVTRACSLPLMLSPAAKYQVCHASRLRARVHLTTRTRAKPQSMRGDTGPGVQKVVSVGHTQPEGFLFCQTQLAHARCRRSFDGGRAWRHSSTGSRHSCAYILWPVYDGG